MSNRNGWMLSTAVSAALAISPAVSHAVVLYDGSLGTSPTAQGLAFGTLSPGTLYTVGPTSTTLDTSSSTGIYAGFTPTTPPTLDRTTGFTVAADFRVLANAQTNPDRAGFSILALSSDARGIEVAFHDNEIFVQNLSGNVFARGEAVAFDTKSTSNHFDLTILGNTYTLKANGASILTGAVRDYTPYTGLIDPYETPNFLFFGDDSTSASGTTEFSRLEVLTPEPALLTAIGSIAIIMRRRR